MRKYLPYAVFTALTAAILAPLFWPGFVFLLDMTFAPRLDLADYVSDDGRIPPHYPLLAAIKIAYRLLPGDLVQKLILAGLLLLPQLFMYRLARRRLETAWATLAGVLYALNPWVYERFLAGHWLVLLGYALLPLMARLALDFLEHPTLRRLLPLILLWCLYPIFSLHFTYLGLFLLASIVLVHAWTHRNRLQLPSFRQTTQTLLLAALLFLAINGFWLRGFFAPSSPYAGINRPDLAAFQTVADPALGVYVNVFSLYGFWNQDYALPKDTFPYWWLLAAAVLLLSVAGAILALRQRWTLGTAAALLLLPAALLAVGFSGGLSRPVAEFLYFHMPGFKGLRETGKFAGLLAFSYAVLAPLGARSFVRLVAGNTLLPRQAAAGILAAVFFLLPALSVHTAFFGFTGQLRPISYPASWYEAEQVLADDPSVRGILVLPWWGYVRMPFAGNNLVYNPAKQFLSPPVVMGSSFDNPALPRHDRSPLDRKIAGMLDGTEPFDANVGFFRNLGISHILLIQEEDSPRYGFLDQSAQLKRALVREDLVLYVLPD